MGRQAAVACAIFLLSFDPLRISSRFVGGNETFAFVMVGLREGKGSDGGDIQRPAPM
jgi:hypothetical protein